MFVPSPTRILSPRMRSFSVTKFSRHDPKVDQYNVGERMLCCETTSVAPSSTDLREVLPTPLCPFMRPFRRVAMICHADALRTSCMPRLEVGVIIVNEHYNQSCRKSFSGH